MKYVSEFRQAERVHKAAHALGRITTRPWTIMEVCGGQTHAIVKYGLHQLLPAAIRLIHGPGCPVCVTSTNLIDHALHIARHSHVTLCSYGDMLRVPGSDTDLLTLKAKGADVRIIHSPLDALEIAKTNPQREVVLFAVGFETTAPANAMAVFQAKEIKCNNFSLLSSHVLVPPALEEIMSAPDCEVQGFLAAGHVCTIDGYEEYHELAARYRTPIVVTGFEPLDILQGLYLCVAQLEKGQACVLNQYQRSAREKGNHFAKKIIQCVFQTVDRDWRGMGRIVKSGLGLNEAYAAYDAALRFPMLDAPSNRENRCISGSILLGKKKPCECPLFGKQCTPQTPVGAPMVSTEGACSAYYQYASVS